VVAGRALKAERGMTARAESRNVTHLGAAFLALDHRPGAGDTEIGCAGIGLIGPRTAHWQILLGTV
jgi:hypothetical protein